VDRVSRCCQARPAPHAVVVAAGQPKRPATDLVNRQFTVDAPNRLWITDITEHPTEEGKVYCAAVMDAYSRKVIGWSIAEHMRTELVTDALGMSIQRRANYLTTTDNVSPHANRGMCRCRSFLRGCFGATG
jgi:transposase InsO family protein